MKIKAKNWGENVRGNGVTQGVGHPTKEWGPPMG